MNQFPQYLSPSKDSLLSSNESAECSPLRERFARDSSPKQPNMFLVALHQILEKEEDPTTIAWNESGTAFNIFNPAKFAESILPRYYKHSNYLSFVRQLNMYGFKKHNLLKKYVTYSHPLFIKSSKNLLNQIQRSKAFRKYLKPKPVQEEASYANHIEQLIASNQYLKEENETLSRKLQEAVTKIEALQNQGQYLENEVVSLRWLNNQNWQRVEESEYCRPSLKKQQTEYHHRQQCSCPNLIEDHRTYEVQSVYPSVNNNVRFQNQEIQAAAPGERYMQFSTEQQKTDINQRGLQISKNFQAEGMNISDCYKYF